MRAAGKALGINVSNINNYIQRNPQKPYKGIYVLWQFFFSDATRQKKKNAPKNIVFICIVTNYLI